MGQMLSPSTANHAVEPAEDLNPFHIAAQQFDQAIAIARRHCTVARSWLPLCI